MADGAGDSASQVAPPSDDDSDVATRLENMTQMVDILRRRLEAMELQQQQQGGGRQDDPLQLKPINAKDLEKPEKYDNELKKFNVWYERLQDLLANRSSTWKFLFKAIDKKGSERVRNSTNFFVDMDAPPAAHAAMGAQVEVYQQQLRTYLRSYTGGELYARVLQTSDDDILELFRGIVWRGKNKNPNKLLDLKNMALRPPSAHKTADIDKVLTEWRHARREVLEEEPGFTLTDDQMQAILMRIIPTEFVREMRQHLASGKFKDDYHGFEQALQDEVATRKMDAEAHKTRGNVGLLAGQAREQDVHEHDAGEQDGGSYFEEVTVWHEGMGCYINGLMETGKRTRSRSRSRSAGRDERPAKSSRDVEGSDFQGGPGAKGKGWKGQGKGWKGKGGDGKGSRPRPGGPCWTCGGPHFQRECPHGRPDRQNFPITQAWSAWRPGSFPGPTPAQWNSWLPKPKGGKKGKGKGQKGSKGKGKGPIGEVQDQWWATWGPPLGQVQEGWDEQGKGWSDHGDPQEGYDEPLAICELKENNWGGGHPQDLQEQARVPSQLRHAMGDKDATVICMRIQVCVPDRGRRGVPRAGGRDDGGRGQEKQRSQAAEKQGADERAQRQQGEDGAEELQPQCDRAHLHSDIAERAEGREFPGPCRQYL